jgi:hypothetical protein
VPWRVLRRRGADHRRRCAVLGVLEESRTALERFVTVGTNEATRSEQQLRQPHAFPHRARLDLGVSGVSQTAQTQARRERLLAVSRIAAFTSRRQHRTRGRRLVNRRHALIGVAA